MTDFRILQLGKDSRGEVLPKGQPFPLAPGVLVTLADSDGNAMIEHATGTAMPVSVDGKAVYEVAHLRPLQVVEAEGGRFVLMPPYGAFVHERGGHEAFSSKEPKAKKARGKAKAAKGEPRRLRLVYVAPLAILAIFAAGLSLVPEQKPAEAVTEQAADMDAAEEADGEEAAVEADAEEESTASDATPVQHPVPSVPIILSPVPAATPETAAQAPEPAQPAPTPVVAAEPAKAKAPGPKAKQPESKAEVEEAEAPKGAAGKSLPPEREAWVRQMAESYQLEGGFDPEGAQKKLRALKKQVPANARVQKDIDNALKAVGG